MSVLSTKTVFTSKYFRVNKVEIERDGKKFTKDIIEETPVAVILPYTKNGEIYLINEYRDAQGRAFINCIGGKIVAGEDPLTAAKKELHEEAGLTAEEWRQVVTWETSPIMKKKMYVFFAKNLHEGMQSLEDEEKIEVVKLPLSEALEKIETGEIPVALHVAVILLFDKMRREGNL